MDIPVYPKFRPLDISDQSVFTRAFKDEPPVISEFTFTNLYSWRDAYKFQVSALDGLLIISSGSEERKRFLRPIGKGDITRVVSRVIKDTGGFFIRMPGSDGRLFENDGNFKIIPDPDNSDYLYKTSDLTGLAGRKYDGKRNLIKKFKADHSYEYVKLHAQDAAECLDFEEAWCTLKDCEQVEGLRNERQAIKEMIANCAAFELAAGGIKVGGKIRALAIGQRLNPDTLVMHILKAEADLTGLYQVINNEFLTHEGKSFEFVNFEQDMGIAGLRKTKQSYHPARMIEKFTLKAVD